MPGGDVFVLGAGFSKAIAAAMPLTDDLGNEALRRDPGLLGGASLRHTFEGGRFESWLSRRAEAQPYLDTAENYRDRSIFQRATNLIGTILDERVEQALSASMPRWLGQLLSIWHLRRCHVITFNYDTLVECAFVSMQLWDWRQAGFFLWPSLINYTPEGKTDVSFNEADGETPPHSSFRLWKLHGSLNWFWVPGDLTGATVRRGRLPGEFGAPRPMDEQERHWAAPGRERFIVPPAALKSGYYANPVTREIWRRSYSALSEARRITLMGYSVPVTDMSASGMLADALAYGTAKEVHIVDRAPEPIRDRLAMLGTGAEATHVHAGERSIEQYTEDLIVEASASAVRTLRSISNGPVNALYVDWGERRYQPGIQSVGRSASIVRASVGVQANVLVLECEDLDLLGVTTRARHDGDSAGRLPLRLEDVAAQLGSVERLVVRLPGAGIEVPIIDAVERKCSVGFGDGTWVQLVPCGPVPD